MIKKFFNAVFTKELWCYNMLSPYLQLCVSLGCVNPSFCCDFQVKLWNMMSGFCFVTFNEHSCAVTGVVFTPNSQVVLSCSLDGTVRAFDLNR